MNQNEAKQYSRPSLILVAPGRKASCYYTIYIKLKYLLKNQPASLLHTPNHKIWYCTPGAGFSHFSFMPKLTESQTFRRVSLLLGRVGKNQSCLDNSLPARTRGVYQVLVLTAVLVDKDRKTRAGQKFRFLLMLEFWNLGCNLFSTVQ